MLCPVDRYTNRMKRPGDQAKLLFFALLRSTATALATTGEKTRIMLPQTHNIQLRLATKADIPSINCCNRYSLPENYQPSFYSSHLRQWPDLALVAEDVSYDSGKEMGVSDQDRYRFKFGSHRGNAEPKIVAYVLGKIETRPVVDYTNPTSGEKRVETLGHVTSVAVLQEFRRLGLAKSLMSQLHHHLQHHGVQSCGLHVRVGNQAAVSLYQRDGYEIAQIIPSYYQDGEDAYFMRRVLPTIASAPTGPNTLFGKKAWKSCPPELRLPRKHEVPTYSDDGSSTSSSSSGASSTGILAGPMFCSSPIE